jgi:hypothetical protein
VEGPSVQHDAGVGSRMASGNPGKQSRDSMKILRSRNAAGQEQPPSGTEVHTKEYSSSHPTDADSDSG